MNSWSISNAEVNESFRSHFCEIGFEDSTTGSGSSILVDFIFHFIFFLGLLVVLEHSDFDVLHGFAEGKVLGLRQEEADDSP